MMRNNAFGAIDSQSRVFNDGMSTGGSLAGTVCHAGCGIEHAWRAASLRLGIHEDRWTRRHQPYHLHHIYYQPLVKSNNDSCCDLRISDTNGSTSYNLSAVRQKVKKHSEGYTHPPPKSDRSQQTGRLLRRLCLLLAFRT